MNAEDRILLVQDIMGRLPYNPRFDLDGLVGGIHHIDIYPKYDGNKIADYICEVDFFGDNNYIDIQHFKPCLVPMDLMTEEQKEEYCTIQDKYLASSLHRVTDSYELFDWLNKNHFDYRGLIKKGLAIDATNLNVY